MDAKPGDLVKITTQEKTIKGTLIPRPDILDSNTLIIKLESGYNIGIDKEKIKDLKIIKEHKQKEHKLQDPKHNPDLPTISVLSAGGTISSKIDYKTGGVLADYTAKDFIRMIPELEDIANIHTKKIASIMSEDMQPKDWQMIASAIEQELNNPNIQGVVLTQGTDTLHYTSSALSFMLSELKKPVVITASQRSIDRGSSDAYMNLKCAILAAARSNIAEVTTCLHGTTNDDYCLINRGTRTRKMHSTRRDAFRPMNASPLAKVYDASSKIEYLTQDYKKADKKVIPAVTLQDSFEEKIGLLFIYPGIDMHILDAFKDYKGLVIAGTGLGHVPLKIHNKLKQFIKQGMTIIMTTQTFYGPVHPNVYSPLRKLSIDVGIIFCQDILPETAYVKLGFVLGKEEDKDKIRSIMQSDLVGELSQRTLPKEFLS